MDIERFSKNLTPVTSSEIFESDDNFHPEGVYSELIFGAIETQNRFTTFSYIDLKTNILHPTGIRILMQLDRRVEKILSCENYFKIVNKQLVLSEEREEGSFTGIDAFLQNFPNINFRGETEIREKYIKLLRSAYDNGLLMVNKLPVIPPNYRVIYKDRDGNWNIDPLNEIYQSIIRKVEQTHATSGSGILYSLMKYSLQKAVEDHDNYIKRKIEKKDGIIRENLLGKRVDFSGRGVITPGPDLRLDEIGIPFRMGIVLFEPFVIYQLLNNIDKDELKAAMKEFHNFDVSIENLKYVINAVKKNEIEVLPKKLRNLLFLATEMASRDRVVMAKRDPNLHPLSIRGFKPKITHDATITICPMVVGGFNADFDGDQMAIFHPLSDEAQKEIREKMMDLKYFSNSNSISFDFSKEMYVGLYLLTQESRKKNSPYLVLDKDLELYSFKNIDDIVEYRKQITTMGRAIFNSVFPEELFFNQQINKSSLKMIMKNLTEKYDRELIIEIATKLYKLGFFYASVFAPSLTLDITHIPKEIIELKNKLKNASLEEAQKLISEMQKILKGKLKGTGLDDFVSSGAGKGWDQPSQMLIAKGIVSDASGKILEPISGSFAEGLTTKEFFNVSYASRKGIIDRVLNTADTGYFTRQLVYVLNDVEADPRIWDCHTDKYLTLKLDRDLIRRLRGRYLVGKDGSVHLFDESIYKSGDSVKLRSPIFCKTPRICHVCYGNLIRRHRSPYVGVIAAQICGELGTQLIMRTFHTGGAVTFAKRDILGDIIRNNPTLTLSK